MKSRRTSTDGNNAEIDTAIINGPGQIVAEKSPGSAPAAPHFLAPTKAFKVQSVVRTVKQVVQNIQYVYGLQSFRESLQ